jgi:hypothetical protein
VQSELNRLDVQEYKQTLNLLKSTLDHTLDCVFMFDAAKLRFSCANQGTLLQVGWDMTALRAMHPYNLQPDSSEAQFRYTLACG